MTILIFMNACILHTGGTNLQWIMRLSCNVDVEIYIITQMSIVDGFFCWIKFLFNIESLTEFHVLGSSKQW